MSRSNADGRIEDVAQTSSLILADRVVMNSRHGNIRVAGSAVAAERDVSLIAKEGKIDIVAGLDTGSEHRSSSSKTIGDLGSDGKGNGTSSTIGIRKESSTYDRNSATQGDIRSSIISNNGSVTLDAKDDLTLRGADIAARHDLTMVGKEVILDPATDTQHIAESHKTSQYGITNAMGGMVVEAAKAADKAMEAASRGDNRLATLYGAKAALTGYNASQGTHSPTPNAPVNSGGSLFKFTSSVGGGSQQSQRDQSSAINGGTTLHAGETLTMVGTGTGALDAEGYAADGSIRARGAQISARNVQTVAARDIDLGSAQDTAALRSSSKGSNASVGVGLALGGAQNGFTVELGAGQNHGNANGNSVTHQDTIVTASESFTYSSGRDTNLKGAQVIANTIRGTANRNLNIESQQDTDDYQERNRTSGAQLSLCIPPFCYGATVSASVQDSKGNIDSQYASVNRQSGFYAGSGGYDIETKGNTNLKGGVIASTAEDVKNRLKTQTLTTSDIENRASYSAKNSNVAVSVSAGSSFNNGVTQGINWGGGTSPIQNATNNATSMAAANLQKPQTGTATGTTRSAISPGTVTITDDAAQQKLTGKTATETVASLNRDTANANQTVKPIFDKQKIERQQEIDRVMAEVAQQAAPILYQKVGDALQNQPAAVKAAVHGLVGGLMAKAMGGEFASGAAGAAAAALAMEAFGKDIANLDGLNQADKDALTQMMGLVVAKVGSMAAGAGSTASNAAAVTGKLATEFNYLKHDEVRSRQKELNACRSGNDPQCEVDVLKKYEAISAKNTADVGSSGPPSRNFRSPKCSWTDNAEGYKD
ncbi:hemagglutinin repeat-containing protein [Imbroritus primus]|uniref:hemagglutinin repeat-containing protein n=1 Tax=Imbroritus primus TaxID=3058603 RepID=UPI0002ED2696